MQSAGTFFICPSREIRDSLLEFLLQFPPLSYQKFSIQGTANLEHYQESGTCFLVAATTAENTELFRAFIIQKQFNIGMIALENEADAVSAFKRNFPEVSSDSLAELFSELVVLEL